MPHLGLHWWYCHILFGFQARFFYFSMFHNLKSYWIFTYSRFPESNGSSECLKEYFYCFASCMGVNIKKYLNGIEEEKTYFHALLSPTLWTLFINLNGLILIILTSFIFFLFFVMLCNIQHSSGNWPSKGLALGSDDKYTALFLLAWPMKLVFHLQIYSYESTFCWIFIG